MSYISNGCNDCASVDFGNSPLLGNSNQMNFLNQGSSQGNIYEPMTSNQFVYQGGQQQQQPQQQPQMVQPQQPMVQQMPVQVQPKVQVLPNRSNQQAPANQQKQIVVGGQAPSQGVQGVITNYLRDNVFTIALAFLVASAWHTTIKYYIDQSIKFNAGTPTYYIVYAVLATLATIFFTTMKY